MPKVDKKILPITVVAMQYWADAGTELLPAMAQIGRHTEVTHDVIMRVRRIAFLLVFKSTG